MKQTNNDLHYDYCIWNGNKYNDGIFLISKLLWTQFYKFVYKNNKKNT